MAQRQFEFVLASSSPRRQALLRDAGYSFKVIAPPIQEPDEIIGKLPPAQQAESLAYFKARSVADAHPGVWVLAADTIVTLAGKVMGKAADADAARAMLRTLSGTRHTVVTGVALLGPDEERLIASDVTHVTMRKMSPLEIESYIASGEWIGKAGAYAIQETADRFVQKVEGSFSNVVGLPVELVGRMIAEMRSHPQMHKAGMPITQQVSP
ncbi:MAG: nucleoside triphosphate pyrophosphatase [Phycisphaerae bacterium]